MEELLRCLLEMGVGQADLPPTMTDNGESLPAAEAVDDDTTAAYQDAANEEEDTDEGLGPGLTSEQVSQCHLI